MSEVLHGGETGLEEAESKGVTPVTKTPSPVKYVSMYTAGKNKSDILSRHGINFVLITVVIFISIFLSNVNN